MDWKESRKTWRNFTLETNYNVVHRFRCCWCRCGRLRNLRATAASFTSCTFLISPESQKQRSLGVQRHHRGYHFVGFHHRAIRFECLRFSREIRCVDGCLFRCVSFTPILFCFFFQHTTLCFFSFSGLGFSYLSWLLWHHAQRGGKLEIPK